MVIIVELIDNAYAKRAGVSEGTVVDPIDHEVLDCREIAARLELDVRFGQSVVQPCPGLGIVDGAFPQGVLLQGVQQRVGAFKVS